MCVCEYLAGGAVHVLCVTRLWLEMETSECRAEPLEKPMAACRIRVNEGMNAGMTEPNNKPTLQTQIQQLINTDQSLNTHSTVHANDVLELDI